ncbi:MAG: mlaE 2 [Gammaproteobacteria bacterium]|jgi:phospholipid/cholesterol/gamma-HCH transport system permease protein|nr:mlaE 2 [Gammaproteobacteria bacterium]
MLETAEKPNVSYRPDEKILVCEGSWTILNLTAAFENSLKGYLDQPILAINGESLVALDAAGAELLSLFIQKYPQAKISLNEVHQKLLDLIKGYSTQPATEQTRIELNWLERIGKVSYNGFFESGLYLAFVGESFCLMLHWLLKPQRILWRNIGRVVEATGYDAMPIVGLLSFLVGIVLAYQMGVQLENYGANIFVVNLLGISILREFAPLMTAIIVAGRTGAAFTAELGTMKVNQELDALMTMGVKPVEYLILPKILGLVIALPLLSVWASFSGILGGMIMSKGMLNITFAVFMHQFQEGVALKQLWIGLIKTPVFAFIISSVGCFQGIQVQGGAESVGIQTTRSVVQSLFLIIVADAFFSILLSTFHA